MKARAAPRKGPARAHRWSLAAGLGGTYAPGEAHVPDWACAPGGVSAHGEAYAPDTTHVPGEAHAPGGMCASGEAYGPGGTETPCAALAPETTRAPARSTHPA